MKYVQVKIPRVHRFPLASGIILVLVCLLFVVTSVSPVIFDDNEGLYAGAVREMAHRGDWLVPTTNGFPRIQKPPLVYWTMLISRAILGQSEFSMRLPNALATFGWIAATYLIARSISGERLAQAATLTLASMTGVCIFTHLIQPEPFLACFTSFSLWTLLCARQRHVMVAGHWYVLFWMFLALGTLSKGLHGALWPLGTVLLTALIRPETRRWLVPVVWGGAAFIGMGLFLLMVLPWYIYMTVHFPGFLSAHFLNEQVGASLNTRFPPDAHPLPILQFYLQHLIFWLPWTPFIPALILVVWRQNGLATAVAEFSSEPNQKRGDEITFLVVWTAFVMTSVVFSTRQDYYAMCSWGEIAIAFGLVWANRKPKEWQISQLLWLLPCAGLFLLGAVGGVVAEIAPHYLQSQNQATAPIGERDTFADAISGISPDLWAKCLPLLKLFSVAFIVGGLVSTYGMWMGRRFLALTVYTCTMAAPFILSTIAFGYLQAYFSTSEAARAINQLMERQPDMEVVFEGAPNTGSSLYYYLNAPVNWLNAPFNNQYAQRILGLGRDKYWDEKHLSEEWASSRPVYLIIEQDRLDYWKSKLTASATLITTGTRVVITNHPL